MANRSLGSLTLNLIAEIGGYIGPLSKAERASAAAAAKMKKDIEQVAKAGTLFAVGVGTAFTALVKNSINLQDEMSKASQKIGVSVGDLSKLNYAADLSGVAFESLVSGLGKFNKNLSEAFTSGTGAASDALADLGVEIKDTNGRLKGTNEIFLEVADRLSGLQDGATKTTIAMDLFGKSGADLIPLLNSGKNGLADMATEAEKLGQVLDADAAKKAEEFNDNLTRLQKTFTGVANAVATEALPELTEFSEKIKDPAFQEGIAALAKGLVSIATNVARTAGYFGQFASFLGEEFAAQINGISGEDIPRLTKRLQELNASLDPKGISDALFTAVPIEYITKSTEEREKERDAILRTLDAYKQYQNEQYKARNAKVASSAIGDDPFALTPEQRADEINRNRKLRELEEQRAKEREKAAEAAKAQVEKLQQAFATELESLQREVALYGEVTKAQAVRYETERGNLAALDPERKKELIYFATLADLRDKDAKAQEAKKEAEEKQKDQTQNIADMIKQQEKSIALAKDSSRAAEVEYEIRTGILEVVGGINSAQAQALINNAKILDSQERLRDATTLTKEAVERIDEAFADTWLHLEDGFEGLRDSIVGSFKKMLAEMAHAAITKPITLQIQQALSGGIGGGAGAGGGASGGSSSGGGAGAGALAAGGIYAAVALAVVAGVQVWNKQQEERFVKMTSEYKQANQGLSRILGEGNKKSAAIANGIESLKKNDGDILGVNYKMLASLEGIRAGITDVAAGFAKTLVGSADYKALGIKEGKRGLSSDVLDFGNLITQNDPLNNFMAEAGRFATSFGGAINNKILDTIFSSSKKVIDSGISIIGTSLGDILSGATLEAFNYADVRTKKKFLGVTTSTKVKRTQEELDAVFAEQFTDVFRNASDALRQASGVFGTNFDNFIGELTVKTQDLSLKGLEGDALVKEIESFFGSTLDNWAEVLLGGTNVLTDFQQIGESAFDTMLRLASETQTFNKYAEALNLNFKATGTNAVYATQAIAEAAGGFDKLSSSLSVYYGAFFSESEKFEQNQTQLAAAFKNLNIALPASREGFKQLIQGLDLTNAADQERFAQLIKLAGVTDEYFKALEKETEAKKDATKAAQEALKASAGEAFDNLTRAVDKQKQAIQKQIDAASNALNSTKAVADSLNSTLQSMTLQSSKNELANRRQAQAQIIAANAIAKAGGPLPVPGQLDKALNLLSQPSQDLYASFEDYARDFYTTSRNIKELADATGKQQTYEEQNLEALNAQVTALDDMVKFYQTQIDKLNDVNTSVLSVRNAVLQLTDALADAGINVPTQVTGPEVTYAYEKAQVMQSQEYASLTPSLTSTSVNELIERIDTLTEQLEASQFAIAKNTLNTAKILQRWDADGMPLEISST